MGKRDVLLPNKYVPQNTKIEDEIDVFIYKDSAQRPIATTLKPLAELHQARLFEVMQITEVGAFVDWGLEKDLLIPFSEQTDELEVGDLIVAYVTLDPKTERIVASMHIESFFGNRFRRFERRTRSRFVDLQNHRFRL